ncbi:dTDP-glucose 4,6-dehydratase [Fistulifera solaris]|uniref:dTDP-glucose 4,6-dehydratase n=1 Tax=Fistulifera solaris TaxID=1519565 RepID=A0A1Z5KBI8_FISSO|nr:dTDP-glucose 4,6-dehydratase [Fistulifera solaris]|eukprot:GAX23278.1 dTDP-glucose 4,6-dehydratase [Fistulifera solaris]
MTTAAAASEDYVPQNIMITGGAGFIASHVAILLCKKYPQYKIVVYDNLDYCACLANLQELFDAPNFKFVKGDITSPDLVSYVLKEEKIDTILHFAAQTHVDNSFGNSFAFTQTNIFGTHVLLESAKCCEYIKRFVHVSTDEVYGEGEDFDTDPMSEEHVLEPTNPYAATKAGAEFLVKSYFRSFKMPCLITRGNNVYGPHQFPEKLIPKFTNMLLRDIPLTIHGDGTNTRNFLYVTDVANAFDTIMHKGEPGHVYNIGGKNEIANIDVARALLKLFGKEDREQELITFVPDRKFNDLRYTINSNKLHELGWKELMNWEEGLKTTVDWYKQYSHRYGNIDAALVAHPRMLNTKQDVEAPIAEKLTGKAV